MVILVCFEFSIYFILCFVDNIVLYFVVSIKIQCITVVIKNSQN